MMAEQLPEGWIATSLSEIASKLVDGSHNPPAKQATGLPMLSAVNINDNKILFSDFRLITEPDFKQEDQRTRIAPGDVLLTIVGAIGRTAVVPEGIQKFTLQRSVAVITPVLVPSKFLMYQIESPRVAQYFKDNARGTAQKGVYLKTLGATEIWLPPLAEQHRIVAKIEELFSELDQGVVSLKTAREQLKVYRQSLLKNAFEGKLTAAWRAAHRDQLETAAALQQRIARERQARYQQQLADWQTAGQTGPKPKPPKPLPPLTAEELAELPELPAGWGWARLLDVCEAVVDCHNKTAPYQAEGIPLIRTPSIRDMRLNFDDSIRYISQETYAHWSRRCPPLPGDILFTREAPMGEAALIPEGRMVCMGQRIMLLRPGKFLSGKYLLCATQNPFFKKISDKVAVGTGVKHLRVGDVERLVFPICSQLEQQEIADQLDAKLSEADQLDQTLVTALQQADALRQSILKKAFSGQLVKQDKNEEPATALLERIRASRGASPAKGRQAKLVSKPLTNC
jgi:type I restriction enzyme S subunit